MSGYMRVPKELIVSHPHEFENQQKDVYGVEPRLDKLLSLFCTNSDIVETLAMTKNPKILDMGGNSGYFSFGLISAGIASSAQVIDSNPHFIDEGRRIAEALGKSNAVLFVNRKIDLHFAREEMEFADIIIMNNLLHHAGYLFDNELVEAIGWDNYLIEFLNCAYDKSTILVLGLGLKRSLPMFWLSPRFFRFSDDRYWHLEKLVKKTNWKIQHYAFVDKLDRNLEKDLPSWRKKIGYIIEPLFRYMIMTRAWLERKTGLKLRPAGLDQRKFYVMLLLSK